MKYSGIDLHSNNSVVTVTDEEDRVIAEKRLPNESLIEEPPCSLHQNQANADNIPCAPGANFWRVKLNAFCGLQCNRMKRVISL